MSEAAAPALDAPELPLSDYRALREGRSVERAPIETRESSEAPPAEKKPPAEAESGAGSEPAEDTNDELEGSEEGKEQQPGEKKPGPKKGLVDEVIKLRRENRELKTRGAPAPDQQAQQPKPAPQAAPVEVAPPADDPEPDIKKYSDYEKYNRDLIRWEVRQTQRQAAAEAQQRAEQDSARARVSTWQERVSSAAADADLPNFEAIAFQTTLPISRVMGDAIMSSEVGPRVLYHLGSNPGEAARISKLSPIDQIREIGKLEVTLSKPAEAAPASDDDEPTPQKQAISKAPAPIPRPAGSGAKPAPSLKSLEGISQAEYRALRESGKLR
jgi:hypothetical protein